MSTEVKYLTKNQIYTLLIYFPTILIISLISSIYVYILSKNTFMLKNSWGITNMTNDVIITLSLLGSISLNLCACSIFYIRKLYKIMISDLLSVNNSKENIFKCIGTFIYFLFRPIFSISFSILLVIGLNAGLLSVASKKPEFNTNLIDICMFFSFFIGFASGNFLNSIEIKSKSIIKTLMNTDNK
ncbi:hypothetical protein [Clostridium baratii]|uniref:hypothetical protein n=1 Tax=Clostridium baratii TaxID=1561 RepID=UPI00097FA6B2|nr:hypothetical protein [Clostridium baratii]AQM59696.1 hypothetical protein NPD11_401 [Clostridium baratii]